MSDELFATGGSLKLDRVKVPLREGFEEFDSRLVRIVRQYNGLTAAMQSAISLFAPAPKPSDGVLKREVVPPRKVNRRWHRTGKVSAVTSALILACIVTHPLPPILFVMSLWVFKVVFQDCWKRADEPRQLLTEAQLGRLGLMSGQPMVAPDHAPSSSSSVSSDSSLRRKKNRSTASAAA